MILNILFTIILVLFNGFFVAAEFAIVKVRTSQLELKSREGNNAATLSKKIVSHLDAYLAATQLGITLASLGLGWIGEPMVSRIILGIMNFFGIELDPKLAKNIALPLAFVIITVLHIVFGELAPKSLAIQRPQKTTLAVSYPLYFFHLLFKPFIWILNGIANFFIQLMGFSSPLNAEEHSSEELKYLVEQEKDRGTIEETDYNLIKNAFGFSDHTARQLMVPRMQIVAVDVDHFDDAVIEKLIDEGYSRIPCYKDNLDNIVGIIHLKDILSLEHKKMPIRIDDILRPAYFVPGNKRVGHLLQDLQINRQQLAVVVDEYGGTKGIITMEDIMEELVGEIQDEYDDETPVVEKTAGNVYLVKASAPLDDINEMLPHPFEKNGNYETLAGLLNFKFGKIPDMNEKIETEKYEITVVSKDKNFIETVSLTDLEKERPDK
ncbi:MAG: hemolysin family protein [Candidatus Azobacteroides sp.]|nr:hemolysin family protein [Candidatus Azobacteroides sp.]